jgi:ribosome biogenesis GTPase A
MPTIQWYPGHIAKWDRQIDAQLKGVDVVIEVLDARVPAATVHPELTRRIQSKPVLRLLNKASLSDPDQNRLWLEAYREDNRRVLLYDAHEAAKYRQALVSAVLALGEPRMAKMEARGIKRRPVRTLIVGMPNVGKSSIINSIVGRKKTRTGHKAGVTRAAQWIRIHPQVELMDSPGVIPPRLGTDEVGGLLAVVSSVSDATFDEAAVSAFLLERVERLYPGHLAGIYGLKPASTPGLTAIAVARGCLGQKAEPDLLRAGRLVLKDFRQGRWGKLTLEHFHATTTEVQIHQTETKNSED